MVNVKTTVINGEKNYLMKNHLTGSYYDLDELSKDVWDLIDGTRTVAGIYEEIQGIWKDVRLHHVTEPLVFFAREGCLKALLDPIRKKRVRIVSAFEVNVSIVERSKNFLESVYRIIRPALKKPLLWASLLFVILAGSVALRDFVAVFADSSNFEILGSTVVGFFFYYFVVLAPVIAIHEMAHGLALVHFGGTPGEIGTGLYYFGPIFYIFVTDAWSLTRGKRIMVMLAGPLSTLLIGSGLVAAVYLLPFPASISHMLFMAAFFCFYGSWMDFSPLFEVDGYYVLMDALNSPNLREDSFNYLKAVVRKVFRRPLKEEPVELTTKQKRIFLGYAVLSIAWAVLMAYQTMTFLIYMTGDVTFRVQNIFSASLIGAMLPASEIVVSIVSIFYFMMTVVGYGVMLVTAIKKARVRTLRFETIHDRDFAVFLYLPTQTPESVVDKLKRKMTNVAKDFTPNFSIQQVGPLCLAVLRMGSTRLAHIQLREHLGKIEHAFSSMYQDFLRDHERDILRSGGIYSNQKIELATLLRRMANEAATMGKPEAKSAIDQIITKKAKDTQYLLNSVFGTVWTIELPPAQQQEMQKTLLPTLFVEDLAITDLYDEVEDFKKCVIYGFDSLAKLASEKRRTQRATLAQPEIYQVVSSFEPIKGRLIFVGRTEQIEKDLYAFGSLFVCQAWSGYLDNLLSETTLTLSALGNVPLPSQEAIQALKDQELTVLRKNLSTFVANARFINESMKNWERHIQRAHNNLEELEGRLKPTAAFEIGLLNAILTINAENLGRLPKRFAKFKKEFQELFNSIQKTRRVIERECERRKDTFSKKKRTALLIYIPVTILSFILALVGLQPTLSSITIPSLVAALLLQTSYWTIYLLLWKSFHTINRYPSPVFSRIHVFTLALTETLYKFISTADVLSPIDVSIEKKPSDTKKV
jgi:hypothetical protein